MLPNTDQTSAALTTIIVSGLSLAAAKGWIPGDLVTVIASLLVGVIIHFLQNTQKSVVTAAGKVVNITPVEQAKVGIENPVAPPVNPNG